MLKRIRSRIQASHLFVGLILLFSTLATNGICQEKRTQDDWSQWMGKDRKGEWHLDLQKESLNDSDLIKRWEVPINPGYCGPTVSNNKVYLMDYAGNSEKSERVICLDAETGAQIWTHAYECSYSVGYPTGPRASVLIDGDRAYSLGTMGDLYCLNANSGKVLWYINGQKEYNIDFPIWGLSSSPLIEGDILIVQIGGRPDACLAAFNKLSGKEVWRALSDNASYSSPTVIDQAGNRVLVCWTGDNLVGLDPNSGIEHWKIPYIRSKDVINIASPVLNGPYIFLSSFYDGSMLIKISEQELTAQLLWTRKGKNERETDALHCITSTPIIYEGYIYGIDSYGEFRCLDLMTGDRLWTDSTLVPYGRWSNAHLIKQKKKLWAFNEKGELILGELSPQGFEELGRTELVKPVRVSPNPRGGVNWAHPAFAGRKIFARSDAVLACYEMVK